MGRKALFIKTKNFGDAVVLTSAISALPEDFSVHVLCFAEVSSLYIGLPRVEQVWVVRRGVRGVASAREAFSLLRGLRGVRYDLLAQFSDDWRGALLSRLLRPVLSVARQTQRRGSFWHNSFHVAAKRVSNGLRHAADADVDLLRAARLYVGPAPCYISPIQLLAAGHGDSFLGDNQLEECSFVVLHLTSRWSFKELPLPVSRDVIVGLLDRGFRVVTTGDEQDAPRVSAVLAGFSGVQVVPCLGRSLSVFAGVLSRSSALVSIDSFSVHLASALQIPSLCIYGPSSEVIWAPHRVPHRVVTQSDRFSCRPCGLDGCGGGKVSECLRTIGSGAILRQFDELMLEIQK